MSLMRLNTGMNGGLFDRFFDADLMDWATRNFSETNTTIPSVNIRETDDGYAVEMAAPGLSKSDFKVELLNDTLTISSEKQEKKRAEEKGRYTKQEFAYQSFKRSFHLPSTVEEDQIMAKYEDGILKVWIPKKEEAKPKPAKLIDIK